jgi:hypothetical protein
MGCWLGGVHVIISGQGLSTFRRGCKNIGDERFALSGV